MLSPTKKTRDIPFRQNHHKLFFLLNVQEGMDISSEWVVIYDGKCGLCNTTVSFISRRKKGNRFLMLTIQSESGEHLANKAGISSLDPDSVIFFDGANHYLRSDAILEIVKRLGGFWTLLFVFKLVPPFLRDLVYQFVARHRHKFTKSEIVCADPNNS